MSKDFQPPFKDAGWRNPHEYTISRVPVKFPVKAYPSQMAMMSKIISSLQRGQNCLLESPTGSGKSLALLCAALAWQTNEIARVKEYNDAVSSGIIEPEEVPVGAPGDDDDSSLPLGFDTGAGFYIPENEAAFRRTDSDDDFQDPVPNPAKKARVDMPSGDLVGAHMQTEATAAPVNVGQPTVKKVYKKKVPKIYFGTRTHRQITQIIRELNKTAYSDTKMSILGSREHACIEPNVSKSRNKNEGCRELMDNRGCSYHSNVKTNFADHHAFDTYRGQSNAWDMEDMVRVGKKVKACPYYGIRELMKKSRIIFCPYNYLVEPMIRNSMEINLKNNIVILDEAHNIEDSARSAASWQVSLRQLKEAKDDLEKMAAFNRDTNVGDPQPYFHLSKLVSNLMMWIEEAAEAKHGDNGCVVYKDFQTSTNTWNGTDIVAIFVHRGFGPDNFKVHKEAFAQVQQDIKDRIDERSEGKRSTDTKGTPILTSNTSGILDGFITVMGHIYDYDQQFRDDFRVAVARTQERVQNEGKANRWRQSTTLDWTYTAYFWCLNPAVIFHDLKDKVRSIVLTSGTLSPMTSFSSELNLDFPIQLEANHVIDKKQVWIGTLSHGPSGHVLKATYDQTESYQFQDEIGRLVLQVCKTFSHGVLLFLPSYKLLSKLTERWEMTGLKAQIEKKKLFFTEPRFSDEFEAALRHFNDIIEETSKTPKNSGGIDGALFIAVCRGKVSEGLDFSDNNARAVICLGIPFPNIKDTQVNVKMKYNDKRRDNGNKNILPGRDWYEIQAFRALNQALGRCIRHRQDWGAIIMVDQRFGINRRYVEALSKWVRKGVVHYNNCHDAFDSLTTFKDEMEEMDRQLKAAKIEAGVPDKPPSPAKPDVEPAALFTNTTAAFEIQKSRQRKRGTSTKAAQSVADWMKPLPKDSGQSQYFQTSNKRVILSTGTEIDKPRFGFGSIQPLEIGADEVTSNAPLAGISHRAVPDVTSVPESPQGKLNKENSSPIVVPKPMAKKKPVFKFTRITKSTDDLMMEIDCDDSDNKDKPSGETAASTSSNLIVSVSDSTAASAEKPAKVVKRTGFVPRKKRAIVYHDDSDDDDFQ